ncbi:MAG: winged helix-turn-helix domain-containing protein [Acidobacteria bacterium]|nr:winged helix-turn-helix domain-containing protein [Acidobacteriota bacterium]MBI3423301.1 winged helix-turn-helix domain-containing protein [Acidobacteriota bacterium]
METQHKQLYEFGSFRLDAAERLLLRAGEAIPLAPKTFDLLLALVAQPGHLLEKETLLKTVWPDSFVEENNLADNISRLRKTLGEGEQGQKFIETIPKRGYRFVAVVKVLHNADAAVQPLVPTAPAAALAPARLRLRQRPELFLVVFGFLALTLLSAGIYWRYKPAPRADVEQLEFKGNFYISRWTEAEIRQGLEYYQRAIALAPRSASAYDGLAVGWLFLSDLHLAPRAAMPKAQAANAQALQCDEAFAPAHVTLGVIKTQYEWDWVGAEREFKRAIALAPDYQPAHQLYGWHLIAVGRLAEAQAEMKHAADANPLDEFSLWQLGLAFYFARQPEQAIEQYRRALGVEPRSYWPHLLLGWAYEQQGKFAEALVELQQAQRLNDSPQILASLGHAYAAAGQRAEAQKVLAELQEIAKHKYVSPYDVATIYAGLGEHEQALAWLEKAYEDRSGWLALWLKVEPKFDGLRAEHSFNDLLRRVGHTP